MESFESRHDYFFAGEIEEDFRQEMTSYLDLGRRDFKKYRKDSPDI